MRKACATCGSSAQLLGSRGLVRVELQRSAFEIDVQPRELLRLLAAQTFAAKDAVEEAMDKWNAGRVVGALRCQQFRFLIRPQIRKRLVVAFPGKKASRERRARDEAARIRRQVENAHDQLRDVSTRGSRKRPRHVAHHRESVVERERRERHALHVRIHPFLETTSILVGCLLYADMVGVVARELAAGPAFGELLERLRARAVRRHVALLLWTLPPTMRSTTPVSSLIFGSSPVAALSTSFSTKSDCPASRSLVTSACVAVARACACSSEFAHGSNFAGR